MASVKQLNLEKVGALTLVAKTTTLWNWYNKHQQKFTKRYRLPICTLKMLRSTRHPGSLFAATELPVIYRNDWRSLKPQIIMRSCGKNFARWMNSGPGFRNISLLWMNSKLWAETAGKILIVQFIKTDKTFIYSWCFFTDIMELYVCACPFLLWGVRE